MQLIPIHTPVIHTGDDLADIFSRYESMADGDILVVSSKIMATAEGNAIDLKTLSISTAAEEWSIRTKRNGAFMQAVLDETARLNGRILGGTTGALLTELSPRELETGVLLVPNAGLDESNIEEGYAIGWPHEPVMSLKRLQQGLNRNCALIISDSCCQMRRNGVTAFALASCGIDPFKSEIGHRDLFGKTMQVTVEATADQLATAANTLMGNTAQSIPAVIIRDHGLPFSNFCGWVDGIEPERDLFSAILK